METETEDNQSLCRLCDKSAPAMRSVFEKTSGGEEDIMQLIKKCLPLVIYKSDPLSKEICEECLSSLDSLSAFYSQTVETAKKQQERLKSISDGNSNVETYLGQLESSNGLLVSKVEVSDRTTSPFENGQETVLCTNCKKSTVEPETNEIEMCEKLHQAIADSLKNNNQHLEDEQRQTPSGRAGNVVLRSKRKRNEGFYAELDESQDSSVTTDFTYTESTQNTESQSDMELCESEPEYGPKIEVTPAAKRRKLMGPKSVQEHNERLEIEKATEMEVETVFNPLSLFTIAINKINSVNVPDFSAPTCVESTLTDKCRYCGKEFDNVKKLAVHEAGHINIEMGVRVDDETPWHPEREDAEVRNKWLERYNEEESDNEQEEDLLVPVVEATVKGEVTLVNGKPMVNGVPLGNLPKEERRLLYKNITISGLKRKFCPLCRYTFKDNWAIESHYFSSSCHYTCRYCGIRFNKQRYQFDEHLKHHEEKGDEPSDKVFAPRKWNGAYPKVISENKLKPRLATKPRLAVLGQHQLREREKEKNQAANMKHLVERKSLQPNLRVKTDLTDTSGNGMAHTPSNQAYFCRKCYQVFFKLDEFNAHVTNCSGDPAHAKFNNAPAPPPRQQQPPPAQPFNQKQSTNQQNSDGESYSATGRPIRHCVREVSTYRDEPEIDLSSYERKTRSSGGAAGGFECQLCYMVFPTVHSRNSHMRVHKDVPPATEDYNVRNGGQQQEEMAGYENYMEANIKQEPLEPIVEIDESPRNFPSSIGSVSITPIPKSKINPNIMKLVQNNPHLTIKSMANATPSSSASNSPGFEGDRTYKCASCGKQFSNKSHLYFHKKNQCGGSKYPCPFCKKRFGTESAYSSHIFYSHPE